MPESKKNSSNPSHSRTTTQKRSIWQKTVTKEKVVKMKTLENNSINKWSNKSTWRNSDQLNKYNQQWKHPKRIVKINGEMETSEETVMKKSSFLSLGFEILIS